MKGVKPLVLAAFGLAVADVLFTGYGLAAGYVVELNPLFQQVFFAYGLAEGLVLALLVNAGALLFLAWAAGRRSWVRTSLWGVLAVRLAVMIPHIHWLGMEGYLGILK